MTRIPETPGSPGAPAPRLGRRAPADPWAACSRERSGRTESRRTRRAAGGLPKREQLPRLPRAALTQRAARGDRHTAGRVPARVKGPGSARRSCGARGSRRAPLRCRCPRPVPAAPPPLTPRAPAGPRRVWEAPRGPREPQEALLPPAPPPRAQSHYIIAARRGLSPLRSGQSPAASPLPPLRPAPPPLVSRRAALTRPRRRRLRGGAGAAAGPLSRAGARGPSVRCARCRGCARAPPVPPRAR